VNRLINWQGFIRTGQNLPFIFWQSFFRTSQLCRLFWQSYPGQVRVLLGLSQFAKLLIVELSEIHAQYRHQRLHLGLAFSRWGRVFYFWIQTLRVWETKGVKQVATAVSFNSNFRCENEPFYSQIFRHSPFVWVLWLVTN